MVNGAGFTHGPLPDGVELGVALQQVYQGGQPLLLILIIAIDKPDSARPGRGALERPLGVGDEPIKQGPVEPFTGRNPTQGLELGPAMDLRRVGAGALHW